MVAKSFLLALGLAASSAFAAPNLVSRFNQCDAQNTQTQGDNIVCPVIQGVNGLLNFQGDNVGALTDSILPELNELLVADNPVSRISEDLLNGFVLSLSQGIVFELKTTAAVIPQLTPQCRCNMVACNNNIMDAKQNCAINNNQIAGNASPACGQAIFSCAPFYSREQLDQMTGCCSQYQGATPA